jgi:hypothetical protein
MKALRQLACAAAVLTLSAALPATAMAGPASVAVDDTAPALKEQDDVSWQGTVAITNLTSDGLGLSVTAGEGAPAGCVPKLSKKAIGAAQSAEPTLTLPKACKGKQDDVDVTLTAGGATGQTISLTPSVKGGQGDPDWDQLWVFAVAPAGALVVLFAVFTVAGNYAPRDKLQYLDSAYDFKESWASNVTVIGGLLTAVFGSADVVKTFLGEDADRAIALASVGSAIAVGLIGAGPIALAAAKRQLDSQAGSPQVFTVGGLLLATGFIFGGAFGQLWVGWKAGSAMDLGGFEDGIVGAFAIGVALLVWYTLANMAATLKAGKNKPPPGPTTELGQLLELLRKTLGDTDAVPDEAIAGIMSGVVEQYPVAATGTGAQPPSGQRRRSAMA